MDAALLQVAQSLQARVEALVVEHSEAVGGGQAAQPCHCVGVRFQLLHACAEFNMACGSALHAYVHACAALSFVLQL